MADKEVVCPSCRTKVTLSEFVDMSMVNCLKCNNPLLDKSTAEEKPVQEEPKQPARKLRMAVREPATKPASSQLFAPPGEESPAEDTSSHASGKVVAKVEKKAVPHKLFSWHTVLPWLLFILLGGITGTLRYAKFVPSDITGYLTKAAPYVMLIIYILVILRAFKDSVFAGILCILIPPYALYYLFLVSDDFWMRAFAAGLLVGTGQDAGVFYAEYTSKVMSSIEEWIRSGGG